MSEWSFITPFLLPFLSPVIESDQTRQKDRQKAHLTLIVVRRLTLQNNLKDEEESAEHDFSQRNSGLTVYVQMFRRAGKAVFLGVVLSTALQFTGINAVMYYGPSIFAAAGFKTGALTATVC